MDDPAIIALYFARDEDALAETALKYGAYCSRIAENLLTLPEDAEECVNDTWLAAWNAIPPTRPGSLRAFLGRITRNLSVARFRQSRAQKRYSGMEALFSELEECLPARQDTESEFERAELSRALDAWLRKLEPDDRVLFLRRYWYGDALALLAAQRGISENRLAQRMRRLRLRLRASLEEGGFSV